MTVCIAALAENEESMAIVTDSKVSFGITSADKGAMKSVPLLYDCTVLIAGNDVAHAGGVIARARKALVARGIPPTIDEVAETLFDECKAERDRIIDASVLRKRGFDWKQYRDKGRDLCPDATYFDLQTEMAAVRLSLDLMIVGFDSKSKGHIRVTSADTPPQDFDMLGFYCIGSGSNEAIASLSHAVDHLYMSRYIGLNDVLYHCLAAKFMAESAQDVGRDTFMLGMRAAGKLLFCSPFGGEDFIRKQWERFGAPRIPKGIGDAIGAFLYENSQEVWTEQHLRAISKYSPRAKKLLKKMTKQLAAQKSAGQP